MDRTCNKCGKELAYNEPATVTPGYAKWEGSVRTFVQPELTCDDCYQEDDADPVKALKSLLEWCEVGETMPEGEFIKRYNVANAIARTPAPATPDT